MATINGTSVGGMTLQIDYSYTQNTTANTTTVTAKLQLVGHYALYATALSGSYISVGGSRTDYSTSISYGGSGTTTTVLATKTVTVSHNSNGTASCNLSGAFVMNGTYRGYSVGTMTVNSTITLPTIPRASGLTVPTSVNTGSTLSGTVSPSSTAFNHKVILKTGSTVRNTISLAAGTTTFSDVVEHSWFPSSTSGTVAVVLETYSGATLIATVTKNVTANVPTSIVPSISAFTAVSSVTSGTFANLYVQGKTTAKLTATATAGTGSSISSYTYSGSGINTTITTNTATTSTLQSSGTQTYTVTVKDARGRSASKTVSITVYPYSAPSIGPVDVKRCDANGNLTESGTYAKYTVNSSYSTVNSKNTRTVTVAYSSNGGSTYSAETTLQTATDTASTKTGVYGSGVFAISSAYVLRFTIKDAYGATNTIIAPLQSAARPINIRSNGKGVSIGAMSTKDAFEVSMAADFNSTVNIDGKLTLAGGLSAPLSIANGGTGASTAAGIASSHNHLYMSWATGGSNTTGYIKFATITVSGTYADSPIEIKMVRRGDFAPTTAFILLSNTGTTDPVVDTIYSYGPVNVWINKSATSTFDLYAWKNGTYDSMSVLDLKYSSYINARVNVKFSDVLVTSVPSTAIMSTRCDADCVVEQGVSSGWNYTKWNNGKSEAWRNIELGDVPLTTLMIAGVYSSTSYNGRGVNFPTGLFTAIPLAFINVYSNGYTYCQVASCNTTQLVYRLWSPYSATITGTIVSLYVVGKWK